MGITFSLFPQWGAARSCKATDDSDYPADVLLAATSDAAAERVLNRVRRELTELNLTVTARDKNIFEIQQPIHSWEHHVYGLLQLCGHLGRQWVLTGDIGHLFDAFSSHSAVAGVEAVHLTCDNPQAYKH